MSEPPSSPPSAQSSVEDALAWYKAQYELLEQELSEFQASSKELEAELEKDLDAADKRERSLRQKAEELSYEVEEWKVCPFVETSSIRRPAGLTQPFVEEIQGVKSRGKRSAEHARERDYEPPRRKQDAPAKTARHRGGQR